MDKSVISAMAPVVLPKEARRRRFWKRYARRQHERGIAWKYWKKTKGALPRGETVLFYSGGRTRRLVATASTPMPAVFCLDDNPEEVIAFLRGMRRRLLTKAYEAKARRARANATGSARRTRTRPIENYFDFSTIETITPSAALVLASIFHHQKSITGWRMGTVNEHLWRRDVRSVLVSTGFHKLLDLPPDAAGPVRRPEGLVKAGPRIVQFESGTMADGRIVAVVQEALSSMLPDDESEKLLYAEPYSGIFEAILNSCVWAYPNDHHWEFPPLERWWIGGSVDLDEKRVTFTVFDQGVTIPVSLPRWTHWGAMESRLKRIAKRLGFVGALDDPRNDGLAIAFAAKIARSKTNLPQHGKGLHTMVEVAARARRGKLRILSRNGEYIWETGKAATHRSMAEPLGGTLVEWTLEL